MPRVRSVLVDNTIGSIFRNVATVSQATAENVIAGTRLSTRSITTGSSVNVVVRNNISSRGLQFLTGAVVTRLILLLATAPRGADVVVRMRKGMSYDTSTTVGDYSLSHTSLIKKNLTQEYNVSVNLAVGESLFFDVISVGSLSPGAGLRITAGFYAG